MKLIDSYIELTNRYEEQERLKAIRLEEERKAEMKNREESIHHLKTVFKALIKYLTEAFESIPDDILLKAFSSAKSTTINCTILPYEIPVLEFYYYTSSFTFHNIECGSDIFTKFKAFLEKYYSDIGFKNQVIFDLKNNIIRIILYQKEYNHEIYNRFKEDVITAFPDTTVRRSNGNFVVKFKLK